MKKFSYWLIAIVTGMVALNAIILYLLWQKRQGRPDPPASAKAYLEKELKLNSNQLQRYDAMRNQHFTFTRSLNEENRQLRDKFFDGIKDSTISSRQSDSIALIIAANQMRIDTATLHHFRQLRRILNAGQQQRFDEIIQHVLHMLGRPHPPRRGAGAPDVDGPMEGPPPGAGENGSPPPPRP